MFRLGFKGNDKYEYKLPSVDIERDHFICNNGILTVKDQKDILINEYNLFLIFPKYLNSMLGYQENELLKEKSKSKYKIDLFNNSHTLFIYSNIVQDSFISNIKSQLLRIFPLEKINDEKQMKSITFNPIIFRPLRVGIFDSITIEIRDSIGNPVIFESGSITITLMLRKI